MTQPLTLAQRVERSHRQSARYHAQKAGAQSAAAPEVAQVAASPPLAEQRNRYPVLLERPTGAAARAPRGTPTVKPLEELPPLVQELVKTGGGTLATTALVAVPLTRAQLESERVSLLREAQTIDRRLRQISDELLSLSPAA